MCIPLPYFKKTKTLYLVSQSAGRGMYRIVICRSLTRVAFCQTSLVARLLSSWKVSFRLAVKEVAAVEKFYFAGWWFPVGYKERWVLFRPVNICFAYHDTLVRK